MHVLQAHRDVVAHIVFRFVGEGTTQWHHNVIVGMANYFHQVGVIERQCDENFVLSLLDREACFEDLNSNLFILVLVLVHSAGHSNTQMSYKEKTFIHRFNEFIRRISM